MSNNLPSSNPRSSWTDQQFRDAIATAQTNLEQAVAAAKAAGTYAGPGKLGDVHSVWAGLVANYKTAYPNHAPLPKVND